MSDFFEDLVVGTRLDLGHHTFTAEEIVDFARRYDPQPFHLDEAAAASEVLVIGGVPLREPVARYGPFVMNSPQEILQAFEDYRAGRMGAIA